MGYTIINILEPPILYNHRNLKLHIMSTETKTSKGFSLDCTYYHYHFDRIDALINHVISSGMDPSYEITLDGRGIGETAEDLIVL